MEQAPKLIQRSVRLYSSQAKYLEENLGKNANQFIRLAVDAAIEKDKSGKIKL